MERDPEDFPCDDLEDECVVEGPRRIETKGGSYLRLRRSKRPNGPRYRGLTLRDGTIYADIVIGKRRVKKSLGTSDWQDAARQAQELREKCKTGATATKAPVPTFGESAVKYLAEDTSHLARTTAGDRARYLRPSGPIVAPLGARRLDEVTPAILREWWNAQVIGRGLTVATGRTYLDAIAGVYAYAVDLGVVESSPVGAFRESIRRRARTQKGRAASDPTRNVRPIEEPQAIQRLVDEASAEGPEAAAVVLLLLDAGLRLGEALGLVWGRIVWGADDDDPSRALLIESNRPRGGAPAPTKSGRGRKVQLSRRLQRALLDLYRFRFGPAADRLVLERMDPGNLRAREWRRILQRAAIGHRALKDLRDTYASQLLTAGVQLGYVSKQLGHADVGITSRHYARWAGGENYRAPMQLRRGEVPADFLARLESHQIHTTSETAGEALDANPRPLLEVLEHETGIEPATSTLATWCSTN